MKKNLGYIDGRRIRVGGVPVWGPVPSVLIPGTMEAYGIFEEFLGVEQLNIGGNSHDWEFWIQNAAVLTQADVAGGVGIITCGGSQLSTYGSRRGFMLAWSLQPSSTTSSV